MQHRAKHGMLSLIEVAAEVQCKEIKILKNGSIKTIPDTDFDKTPRDGGPSVPELRAGLTCWLRQHRPELLQTKLQKYMADKGWSLLFTPPYSPKFQVGTRHSPIPVSSLLVHPAPIAPPTLTTRLCARACAGAACSR